DTAAGPRKTWEKIGIIATVAGLLGIINFFYPPDLPKFVKFAIAMALLITAIGAFRQFCGDLFSSLNDGLVRTTPWLLLLIAVCSVSCLFLLWPSPKPAGLLRLERSQAAV